MTYAGLSQNVTGFIKYVLYVNVCSIAQIIPNWSLANEVLGIEQV
jgi:hypothetical protein